MFCCGDIRFGGTFVQLTNQDFERVHKAAAPHTPEKQTASAKISGVS